MILGALCTRNCRYCSVRHGVPEPPDPREPERVAEAVERLGVRHAVITSVTRDDLKDGGASHFVRTLAAIRARRPDTSVEVLVPDFQGSKDAIAAVLDERPEVFSHNIEVVRRLFPVKRPCGASYEMSLGVLRHAAARAGTSIIKSSLMAGLGETSEEVKETFADLLEAGCEATAVGQYLRPTPNQSEVVEFVPPERFAAYEAMAYAMGFRFAVAAPFVRSSYRSEDLVNSAFGRDRLAAGQR
jgi:lipoic acid synthetase